MPLVIKPVKLHNLLHIITYEQFNLEMKIADGCIKAFMGDLDEFGGEKGPKVAAEPRVGLVEPDQVELVLGCNKQKVHLLVLVNHVDTVLVVADLQLFRLELIQNISLGKGVL